jgi:hypothetical protein
MYDVLHDTLEVSVECLREALEGAISAGRRESATNFHSPGFSVTFSSCTYRYNPVKPMYIEHKRD